jgi:hypothetical protein
MPDRSIAFPRLDFEEGSVTFPERGRHGFLVLTDLGRLQPGASGLQEGVWLFRAESGACGIIPGLTRILREGVRVSGLAVLHHGEQLDIAGRKARFCELGKITLAADSHLLGRSCPYCHDPLAEGREVYRCPLCGEAYCLDCWAELSDKRCYSRNCRFSPGPVLEI